MKGKTMRVLFSLLAILAIAMPSMAAVTINVAVDGDTATVSYVADTEAEIPCAFALDITPGSGATVTAADVVGTTPAYNVFIDYASQNSGTYDIGLGEPWALKSAAGVATDLSAGFCYSAANLENVAGLTGDLFTITGSGDFTIGLNSVRGGVVKAGEAPAVDVVFGASTFTLGAASVCYGDISGPYGTPDGSVSLSDMNALLGLLAQHSATGYTVTPVPAGYEAMDISGPYGTPDSALSLSDMNALLGYLAQYASTGYVAPCMTIN